ncbi:hypothetical protein BSN85_24855 [Bradyrhizobium brasilense]|nr:hypothetical protein BSN85_24855 [Bradyrhizobium brasilense]
MSPRLEQMPVPPADLFDVILVDEAHHSPALTWTMTLDMFPDARLGIRAVLFRARPRNCAGPG